MSAMPVLRSACHRYGYGPRAADAEGESATQALLKQMDRYDPRPALIASAPTRKEVANLLSGYLEEVRGRRKGAGMDEMAMPDKDEAKAIRQMVARSGREHYAALVDARFSTAVRSDAPFMERLVHFWSNHFAVSADKLTVTGFAGLLEMDAVRPHLLGKFEDMLIAVEQHPAMLLYLDQAQSMGPKSPLGSRIAARGGKQGGLNENLAREILELHTLGVRSGYGQADVTEFARALTGWTVSGIAKGPIARAMSLDSNPGDFAFVSAVHEPGPRQIMGRRYDQQGLSQGLAILGDLARNPATAKHIATKLARHFEGDAPSAALIARLEQSFVKTGGDLPSLYRILAESSEVRNGAQAKFKTPWDWLVSAHRALDLKDKVPLRTVQILTQLGQPVWRPGSPAGFDDLTASWAGPDALFRRAEVAERLSGQAPAGINPMQLAKQSLGSGLSVATTQAIMRAESPAQATALLLVSPEFLRR
jgi:uncharacterized protein (DUF1800 family)